MRLTRSINEIEYIVGHKYFEYTHPEHLCLHISDVVCKSLIYYGFRLIYLDSSEFDSHRYFCLWIIRMAKIQIIFCINPTTLIDKKIWIEIVYKASKYPLNIFPIFSSRAKFRQFMCSAWNIVWNIESIECQHIL